MENECLRPVIVDSLKTKHTNFIVDLELRSNVTFIAGDSGTGKSAVFSFLRELSSEDDRIVCLNYIDINKDCKGVIRNDKERLIVIDNADILLDEGIRRHIAMDTGNQYIIMGRDPKRFILSQGEIYEMESESRREMTSFHLMQAFCTGGVTIQSRDLRSPQVACESVEVAARGALECAKRCAPGVTVQSMTEQLPGGDK